MPQVSWALILKQRKIQNIFKSFQAGYVEVVHLRFRSDLVSYEDLVRFFFTIHDPTIAKGTGKGSEYASTIFYHTEEQKLVSERVKEQFNQIIQKTNDPENLNFTGAKVETNIEKANQFWPAHDAHQDYMKKHPKAFCS